MKMKPSADVELGSPKVFTQKPLMTARDLRLQGEDLLEKVPVYNG